MFIRFYVARTQPAQPKRVNYNQPVRVIKQAGPKLCPIDQVMRRKISEIRGVK